MIDIPPREVLPSVAEIEAKKREYNDLVRKRARMFREAQYALENNFRLPRSEYNRVMRGRESHRINMY